MTAAIISIFQGASFDPETTHAMGEAFERACRELHDLGQPDVVKEIIAKRIVEVARQGERNPDELCVRALKALGITDRTRPSHPA